MARALLCFALMLGIEGGRRKRRNPSRLSPSIASCGMRGAGAAEAHNGTSINIVNGEPAQECDWKWQVGLRRSSILPPFCGGVLVSPEWVLTAAHCVGIFFGGTPGVPLINIVAGKYNRNSRDSTEQSSWAKRIIKHPSNGVLTGPQWDLALIELRTPMEMTGCVGTVCLPRQDNDVAPGSKCWITGWGTISSSGQTKPRQLQEGEVTTLSNQQCKDTSYPADQIHESMLCAQGKSADGAIVGACQGDSGGPLVCQDGDSWTVFGLTSFGQGCAAEGYPGVWARVHAALDWIDETMAS